MKKKFLKIGIIGSNEGNGHPISFSSIFNGYNKKYLKKFCKFNLINEYLPKYHKNKKSNIISNAKVTSYFSIGYGHNLEKSHMKFQKYRT